MAARRMSAQRILRVAALVFLSGCAASPLSTQVQSFGASVSFSAASSSPARDASFDEGHTRVCVSERCLPLRARGESKHPLRLQLSFYSPSITDDAARR